MMKNSKLSKVLAAGVSVAMLTSAFAPLAFAENSSVAVKEPDYVFTVTVTGTNVELADPESNWDDNTHGQFVAEFTTNVYELDENGENDYSKPVFSNDEVALSEFVADHLYDLTGWKIAGQATDVESFNVNTLFTYATGKTPAVKNSESDMDDGEASLNIALTVSETADPTAKVKLPIDEEADANNVKGGSKGTVKNGTYTPDEQVTVKLDDTITLPKYTMDEGYDYKYKVETTLTVDGVSVDVEDKELANGASFDLSEYAHWFTDKDAEGNAKYFVNELSLVITGKVVAPEAAKAIELTVDKTNAWVIDEDGKQVDSNEDIDGVSVDDKIALNAITIETVQYGKTFTLPAVESTEEDSTLVFDHWAVKDGNKELLADGVTKAGGFVIENGVVVPEKFLATTTAADTQIELVAVFVDTAEPDEPEADENTYVVTTPKDDVKVFDKNGVALKEDDKVVDGLNAKAGGTISFNDYWTKVLGNEDDFSGGPVYNTEDGVWSYYVKDEIADKFIVDTTVSGIADFIYYTEGVQDTEAYGLKKVSGDDSAFVYLVSDGVYLADYQGLWCDEDGTWYYLIDGCCQTAANGVYEHSNGWFYNFVDGKMVETNGFQMHGTDFYWFVKGECKPEGGADCVEWDGDLYYIEGGKFVPTFNGTFKGSVFVNGVCDK